MASIETNRACSLLGATLTTAGHDIFYRIFIAIILQESKYEPFWSSPAIALTISVSTYFLLN